MKSSFKYSVYFVIICLSGLILFPFIGEVYLFDWDEVFLASVSKATFLSDNFFVPLQNKTFFLEKPPMFIWLQEICYYFVGINEYGARLPNAICGLVSALVVYNIGKRLISSYFGILWSMIFLSNLIVQLYHKSSLIEPWYNFFVFLSLYFLSKVIEMRQEGSDSIFKRSDQYSNILISSLFSFMAILTNGIEGLFVVIGTYLLMFLFSSAKYGLGYFNIFRWNIYLLLFLAGFLLFEYKAGGLDYFNHLILYQVREFDIDKISLTNKLLFHFVIILIGSFPSSIFSLNSFQKYTYEPNNQKIFRLMMLSLLIVVLFISTFIKHKVAHFSSLTYFAISFLASYNIYNIFFHKTKITPIVKSLLVLVAMIWVGLLIVIPITALNIAPLKSLISDSTLTSFLQNKKYWNSIDGIIGILFGVSIFISLGLIFINKKVLGIVMLYITVIYFSQVILIYFVPKIQRHTQGAYIEFVKSKSNERSDIYYYKFESFANDFYADSINKVSYLNENILNLNHKKGINTYVVSKISDSFVDVRFEQMYNMGIYSFYKNKKQ